MLQINLLYSFNYFTISGSCYTEGSGSQGYGWNYGKSFNIATFSFLL